MRLKTLELQGFKSFPDKTVISFDRGITVVVGPNGSGKSNISDAMRWVLGEMSSKNIRGGKMEDVVFAGSAHRSPMGYAEVSVTFSNTEEDGKVPSLGEYDEITVTRRFYRVGESEYFINRKAVRLKDIVELFMGTGLGKNGYSIIGQGKIAEIISQKNDERRAIFEEAAGIAKYRHNKNETVKKLEGTEENLVRLEDIMSVLGGRVGPLEKESEKAKKYLELRDAKMSVDISLSLYDIDHTKAYADEMSSKLVLSGAELERADEARADLDRAEEKAHDDEMANKLAGENLSERILALSGEVHDKEAQIKLTENDVLHMRETVDTAAGRSAAAEETLKTARMERAHLQAEFDKAKEKHGALQKKAEGASAVLAACEEALAENERLRGGEQTRMSELRAAQTDAVVEGSVAEERRDSARQKTVELAENIGKHKEDIEMLASRIRTAEEKIAGYTAKEEKIKAQLDEIDRIKSGFEERGREAAERKNNIFLDLSQHKHKIQNLVRMEEFLEGYSGAVRFVVAEHKAGRILLPDGGKVKLYGPVSGLVTVPEQYSAALEVALGQSLQNIVCEDEPSAKASIAYLKKKNAGRATFYPISTMRGNELSLSDIPENARDGFVSAASALITCDEKFRGIMRSLCGRVLIAKDIEAANRIAKAMNFRYRIVTLDGQVINAGGSFTGGSLSAEGRMLSRRVQIEKLTEEAKVLEKQLFDIENEIKSIAAEAEAAKKDEGGVLSSASVLKTLHDAEATQLTVLQSNKRAQEDALEMLEGELAAVIQRASRTESDIGDIAKRKLRFSKELDEAENRLNTLTGERAALAEKENEARKAVSELSASLAAEEASLMMQKRLFDAADSRVSEIEASIDALKADTVDAEHRIKEGEKKIEVLRAELQTAEKALEDCETEKGGIALQSQQIEKRLTELRIKGRDLMDRRDLLYRAHTKLETEFENMKERQEKLIAFLWDEYELSYSAASARCGEKVTEKTRGEAVAAQTKLKNQLRALGNVNVGAIEEYKEVKAEFDRMTVEISDLKEAKADLLRVISSLDETMKRDFSATFDEISANFTSVFSELFGGGRAELRLSDPDDVLESGIEIHVAPPGKVIKNLSLLSGGEQSFVAIALYFAILKVNPTPFCILDEIEAALDEVNVDKFAEYVKNYSDKTQFVLITHRRGTMEAAERLYGVTMHEKGISDVISINVSEIEQKIGVELK